jgi:hypothetical protein
MSRCQPNSGVPVKLVWSPLTLPNELDAGGFQIQLVEDTP